MSWLQRLLHTHRDPDWQERGIWRYFTCRCGARRVSAATSNLIGPAEPGWDHLLRSRHGVMLTDSGWVTPDQPELGPPLCRACGHPMTPRWHDEDMICSPAPSFRPVSLDELPDRYPEGN